MMKKLPFRALVCVLMLAVLPFAAALAEDAAELERFEAMTDGTSCVHDGLADADALLEAYMDALTVSGGLEADPKYSGSRLTAHNAKAYNLLLPQVKEVANGVRSSTIFTCTLGDLGFPTMLTSTDLGIHVIVSDGELTEEASVAVGEYVAFDLTNIVGALLSDCPYAMYWCDKTQPLSVSGVAFAYDDYGVYFNEEDTVTFYFPVAGEYAVDTYTFDTSVAETVQAAAANAAEIVAQNAALPDADKLIAYRDAICSMTSYHTEAATGSVSYGNPWQLIWVFDDDPDTAVVCEGYAKAFQYLCSLTDFSGNVKCWSVTGTMDGGAHMWNLVRMPNDRVYLVDVTNSDSGTVGSSGQLFMAGYNSGDVDSGFVFRCSFGDDSYMDISYVYDASAMALFSRAQLSVSPAAYQSDDQTAVDDGEFVAEHWQYTTDGVSCTITGYSGPGGDVVIPREIDGCPVTAIGAKAFEFNETITSVAMRDGIVSIGTEAFYDCPNLTSVVIPGSVMEMGEYIFQRCDSLSDVTLGEGLTRIGNGMFCDCTSLTSIQIPSTVETIGGSAFLRCTALTEVNIPANVTLIEPTYFGYFYGCTALQAINVAEANTVYQSIDGVMFSKDGTLLQSCPPGRTGEYAIPEEVSRVAACAFYGCAELTAVTIPEGVVLIGPDVFTECASLKSITIPASVEKIGVDEYSGMDLNWGNVFAACGSLESVSVAEGNERFFSTDGVMFYRESYADGSEQLALAVYPAARSAAAYAVPEGVNRIDSGAFYGAVNLQSITFPSSVTSMRYNAFRGCTGLENVVLPEGLTELGEAVFYDCTGLKLITIPDSVTSIGDYIFQGCSSLTGICCSSGSYAAEWGLANGYTVFTGSSVAEGDWHAAVDGDTCVITQYTGTATELVIPETVDGYRVTGIAGHVFRNHAELVSVSVPDSIASIGAYAFAGCTSLTTIDLPEGLKEISDGMLNGCTSLTSLTIPQSVTSIGGWSIQNCISLTSIVVPDAVTDIGPSAFHSCFALTEAVLSNNLETVGSDAFSDCYQLKSLIIPDSVTSIGVHAFDGCEVLTIYCTSASYTSEWAELNSFGQVVYIDEAWNEPVYEWAADYGTVTATLTHKTDASQNQTETAATQAVIGKSPTETEMGEMVYTAEFTSAFFDTQTMTVQCIPALGDMDVLCLPESLESIGAEAFMNLSCEAVIIPAGCASIGESAFAGCANLIYVSVPGSTVIAEDAFNGCDGVLIDVAD